MSPTALIINAFAAIAVAIAVAVDRRRTGKALKVALKMTIGLLPMVIIIIVLIGLLFAFVSPADMERIVGSQSGLLGALLVVVVGGIIHVPALLAFPLSASLLERGASVTVVAAFITSLTMIGVVTLPLEIKELGRRFALLRNGLGVLAALVIALLMGVIL
ncbi:MAG: permease [Alkalispirochaeta sp.]